MICYFYAILGLALLGGSIGTLTVSEEQHDYLRHAFSDDLDKIYEKIITERRNHYIIGLVIGIILSFIAIRYTRIPNYFARMMLVVTITLGTAVLFYMLMPKSDYMLKHIKTPEQTQKWLEVYKTMSTRYLTGAVLGVLASIPLAATFC